MIRGLLLGISRGSGLTPRLTDHVLWFPMNKDDTHDAPCTYVGGGVWGLKIVAAGANYFVENAVVLI
jgi:hypothetical protein